MKRVYVAGAYSADNIVDCLKNIGRGEFYSAKIFMMGFAPFCPWHDKDFIIKNWDEDFTVEMFYDYSMAWLDVSDIMFLVPGYENSKGTMAEIERAKQLNIPIVKNFTELNQGSIRGTDIMEYSKAKEIVETIFRDCDVSNDRIEEAAVYYLKYEVEKLFNKYKSEYTPPINTKFD